MKYFFLTINKGYYINNNPNTFLTESVEGYILNQDFDLIEKFNQVFEKGEYTKEVEIAMVEYKPKHYFGSNNSTLENGIIEVKDEIETARVIKNYLTPKREQELINLFRKKL